MGLRRLSLLPRRPGWMQHWLLHGAAQTEPLCQEPAAGPAQCQARGRSWAHNKTGPHLRRDPCPQQERDRHTSPHKTAKAATVWGQKARRLPARSREGFQAGGAVCRPPSQRSPAWGDEASGHPRAREVQSQAGLQERGVPGARRQDGMAPEPGSGTGEAGETSWKCEKPGKRTDTFSPSYRKWELHQELPLLWKCCPTRCPERQSRWHSTLGCMLCGSRQVITP